MAQSLTKPAVLPAAGASLSAKKYYFLALLVILADQFLKLAVKFGMRKDSEIALLGKWFKLTFVENNGAAFGLTFQDLGKRLGMNVTEEGAKVFLTLFSLFAVIVILRILHSVALQPGRGNAWMAIFLALVLGGAVGNIIDRVFYGVWFAGLNNYEGGLLYGQVVDMIWFDLGKMNFMGKETQFLPVINLADVGITVGIVGVLILQGAAALLPKKPAESSAVADSAPAQPELPPEDENSQAQP